MIRCRRTLLCLAIVVLACGPDTADREYLAALRGDEDGSTFAERIEHLDNAIAAAPERARYWESRAILRIDSQDFARAVADLDHAIQLADRPYLHFLRGLVLCQAGDCAAAVAEFDRAIADQPENAQFYRGRALALVAAGRSTEALADGERLVQLAPQVGTSWYARGKALASLGRHEAAIVDYEEALRRMPELLYPLMDVATSYDALGDSATARMKREIAASGRQDRSGCAYCLDPYRY